MGNYPSTIGSRYSAMDAIWTDALIELPYDISFLQKVMSLNHRFRWIGRKVLRIRVRRAVERFIPLQHVEKFFRMLNRRRSVIGGSVAQSVVAPIYFLKIPPTDLNIFVPWYASDRWVEFFRTMNFQLREEAVAKYARKYVEALYVAQHADEDVTITLIIAMSHSPLVPILTSCYTSQMNVITHNYVYSVYPKFTLNGRTLEHPSAEWSEASANLQRRSIEIFNPRTLSGPCNVYCALEVRDTWTGSGIAMVPWGDLPEGWTGFVFLDRNSISFRLGDWCRNVWCTCRGHS